jgi:hypothetical protein
VDVCRDHGLIGGPGDDLACAGDCDETAAIAHVSSHRALSRGSPRRALPEPERKEVYDFLMDPGWLFGWKSRSATDDYAFWHKHLAGALKPDTGEKRLPAGRVLIHSNEMI